MFTPPEISTRRLIPGAGSKDAKIAIVGDFPSAYDMRVCKPWQGPAGSTLQTCLHAAGLILGEVYLTNVGNVMPVKKHKDGHEYYNYTNTKGGGFTELGLEQAKRLRAEIMETRANVVVAAGKAAFHALCGLQKLSTYRGYIFPSKGMDEVYKVIPTYDPSAAMRGLYTHRHLIIADLKKAKDESGFPEIVRPQRELVYRYNTLQEALEWLKFYEDQVIVGCDIEVINYEISCISFSSSPELACVIPISQGWTLDEECQLLRGIQRVLGNPNHVYVFQNAIFDIQFMLARNGIQVLGEVHDTMIAHSIMWPELPKGLGFLGSLYCGAQEYWKDSVRFDNIKEES